jgi:hypothetical protein
MTRESLVEIELEVLGDLDSGLTIVSQLPRHLAGDRHPIVHHMILTVADSRELAQRLTELHIKRNHLLLKAEKEKA